MPTNIHSNFAALVLGTLVAGAALAHGDPLPEGSLRQSAAEAWDADVASLALAKGLEKEVAERSIRFQESFSEYAQQLLARYPAELSRVWLEPPPGTQAFVQFTGSVPYEIAPEGVHLFGDGLITRAEHVRRAELVADALKAEGYRNFFTHFDVPNDAIRIEIAVEEAAAEPDRRRIFDLAREYLWRDPNLSGEARIIAPTDLELRVVRRAGPIFSLEHSRGGNWLKDDDVPECTSGWSVDGPKGPGIVTAGHCSGLNQFEESGGSTYSMTWRAQTRDITDSEYQTTSHVELPEFWASASQLRDVKSRRSTISMWPGSSVCRYGRSSNVRDCSLVIEAIGVTVIFEDGVTTRGLVSASGDSAIGGDSGGGVSWSTKAWGIHAGSNGVNSFFSPIDFVEAALGVDLMLAP